MVIKKKANSYNDYTCEFSWGQLVAMRNALADNHSDPVADELYAGISWFFDNIPGPGESEEDLKKEEEAAASGMASPEAGEGQPLTPRADDLLPAPPGEGEGAGMEPEGLEGEPGELGEPGEPGAGPTEYRPGEEPGGPGEEELGEPVGAGAEANRRVPPPPRE